MQNLEIGHQEKKKDFDDYHMFVLTSTNHVIVVQIITDDKYRILITKKKKRISKIIICLCQLLRYMLGSKLILIWSKGAFFVLVPIGLQHTPCLSS